MKRSLTDKIGLNGFLLVILWLIIVSFLSACSQAQSISNQLASPHPTPGGIRHLHPEPATTITLKDFEGANPENAICVEFFALEQIDPETENERNAFLARTSLEVDGSLWTESDPFLFSKKEGLIERVVTNLETGEETRISYANGPFTVCWQGEIGPGLHTVKFERVDSTNDFLTYSWEFIIDD